jgi:hypothetical protein
MVRRFGEFECKTGVSRQRGCDRVSADDPRAGALSVFGFQGDWPKFISWGMLDAGWGTSGECRANLWAFVAGRG